MSAKHLERRRLERILLWYWRQFGAYPVALDKGCLHDADPLCDGHEVQPPEGHEYGPYGCPGRV